MIDKKARDHIIIIEDKLDASSFNELAKIIRKAADNIDISVVSQFPGSTSNFDRNSITEQILGLFEIHSGFSLCITDVLSESHHFFDLSAQSILKMERLVTGSEMAYLLKLIILTKESGLYDLTGSKIFTTSQLSKYSMDTSAIFSNHFEKLDANKILSMEKGCQFRMIYSHRPDMLIENQNASEFQQG